MQAPSSPATPTQAELHAADMSEIIPGLYLGSRHAAAQHALLLQLNIKRIVAVLIDHPGYREKRLNRPDVQHLNIPVADASSVNILQYFEEVHKFIDDALIKRTSVLVHCEAGISRSPTFVISYLMRRTGRSLTEAHDLVAAKRPVIYPNFGFVKQLYSYERVLYPAKKSHFLGYWFKTNFRLGTLSEEQIEDVLVKNAYDFDMTLDQLFELNKKEILSANNIS